VECVPNRLGSFYRKARRLAGTGQVHYQPMRGSLNNVLIHTLSRR